MKLDLAQIFKNTIPEEFVGSARFLKGDVIGIGYDALKRQLFLTRNGSLLCYYGFNLPNLLSVHSLLYISPENASKISLSVNFGGAPFAYTAVPAQPKSLQAVALAWQTKDGSFKTQNNSNLTVSNFAGGLIRSAKPLTPGLPAIFDFRAHPVGYMEATITTLHPNSPLMFFWFVLCILFSRFSSSQYCSVFFFPVVTMFTTLEALLHDWSTRPPIGFILTRLPSIKRVIRSVFSLFSRFSNCCWLPFRFVFFFCVRLVLDTTRS
jgi:hypothetical protein